MGAKRSNVVPTNNIVGLGALRSTALVNSPPVFPEAIFTRIFDYANPKVLVHLAQVSKHFKAAAYEHSRWKRFLDDMHLQTSPQIESVPASQGNSLIGQVKGNVVVSGRSASSIIAEPMAPSSRISETGLDSKSTALTIFNRIASTSGQERQTYGILHSHLAPFYEDIVDGAQPTKARVFKIYRDPKDQAIMLSNLRRFANSDITLERRANILKLSSVCDAFESAVLDEFDQALKSDDASGKMQKYAFVLAELNDAQKAIDRFMVQNPVFRDAFRLGNPLDCFHDSAPDNINLGECYGFFSRLSMVTDHQIHIIEHTFPKRLNVSETFIQKVGFSVLLPYITTILKHSLETSTSAFLQVAPGIFTATMRWITAIPGFPASTLDLNRVQLDLLNEIFDPFVLPYMEKEPEYFKRKSDAETTAWEHQLHHGGFVFDAPKTSLNSRHADKQNFLASFRKAVMSPSNYFDALAFGRTPHGAETGDKATVSAKVLTETENGDALSTVLASQKSALEPRLEGIKSLFSLDLALNLIHTAKGCIERLANFACAGLAHADFARRSSQEIFIILLKTLGNRHVQTGFSQAIRQLSLYKTDEMQIEKGTGVRPLIMFLELVNVGDLIQQMLDVFFEQELVSTGLIDSNDFLSAAIKEKKRFEQMLDERVAAGLNTGIEALMAKVEYVLAIMQRGEDYNPGVSVGSSASLTVIEPTEATLQVVNLISSHTQMMVGTTDKNMLDVFNQEVGLRLFGVLCKHIKRQRINIDGAVRLISDFNQYYPLIQSFKNADLLMYYKALREISQIFLVSSSNAKEIALLVADTERFLNIFRSEEVYEFVERRSDWFLIKADVDKAMYGFGCSIM